MAHTNPILLGGGLHHVALACVDFDRSLAFYVDLLGCQPKLQWSTDRGRAVMLDPGGGNYVELFERPAAGDAPAEARLLHLCLRCDNLDEVVARLRGADVNITVQPKDVPLDNQAPDQKPQITVRLAFFTGPDGEIIELMQCPDL